MTLKYAISALLITIISTNAHADTNKHQQPQDDHNSLKSEKLIEIAKSDVRNKLKDPDSANFRNLSIHLGAEPTDGILYVCGEVNSKNSYGGYTGFTPFYSMIFWSEKVQKGYSAFTGIYRSTMLASDWAAIYKPKCVN